jgi:hypothetical protein
MRRARIAAIALIAILMSSSIACTSTSVSNTTITPTNTVVLTPTLTPWWIGPNGEKEDENVYTKVHGGDGHYIQLSNNPQAHDPSWAELRAFLEQDNTDQELYVSSSFVCTDYAEMLHNNAESEGIRAAYVTIELSGCTNSDGNLSDCGHALNAFNTTDNGLVYVDDTGVSPDQSHSCFYDKTVDLSVGRSYIGVAVFPCTGWSTHWNSMGNVTDIEIQW